MAQRRTHAVRGGDVSLLTARGLGATLTRERGLPGPEKPDDRDESSGWNMQGAIAQNRLACVDEVDVFEGNALVERRGSAIVNRLPGDFRPRQRI